MGLDMYLYMKKSTYLPHWGVKNNPELAASLSNFYPEELKELQDKIFDRESLSKTESFQIGYWRKANAIHHWFVEECSGGIDECQDIYVPKEKLVELRDLCAKVLEDPTQGKTLLPTTDGFFFGNTAYDEWYIKEIKYTKELIDDVLAFFEKYKDGDGKYYEVIYLASW